ncbi:hypothetical protein GV794_16800 [Nocardia cyriacigeorgica]|uniref:GTPase n=1 Tax=Nocardia cyriacigeorgica TaxID=135487 RepID=A0A6P1D965_9NOCA|nr:hypothetical protein [Nocardia cyriacigeorgica]NEW38610.1 hypothetical protein [Nocardia cyriacigeorgica]NEW45303.1 hypothetical protein [Nocardia cyriacigeorgica]NEW49633.1 hypothetical protein [Nocardia cyriacigeorgica]NEW57303.1 hypothetical protein [Nocardia cyriacigeorgica]
MLDRREPTRERDQLDELTEALRQGPGNDPQIGYHAGLAIDRWRMPPRIQVTGRAHTGRTTVLHALALMSAVETGPVDEPGLPDPVLDGDIVVYVLAAAPGPADQRILGSLAPDRTIVVLNKADAVGSRWSDAVIAAEQYGRELGRLVLPVVASLAVRTRAGAITDADLDTLRRHAGNTDPAFTLSPDLFTAPNAGPDVAERTQLLQRWDLYGVSCALSAVRHQPEITGQALLQILHAVSAVDPLHKLLHRRYEQVSAQRGGELLDELTRLAARAVPGDGGQARDVLEDYLYGDDALWTGLCAGLAHPSVAHLAAGYPSPAPADADDALNRAARWRSLIASDMPPAARRAALRVHNGYVRLWERMSSAGL